MGIIITGIVATLIFDLWGLLVSRVLGTPGPAWGLPGRWFAEVAKGRVLHDDIAAVPPVPSEAAIGWTLHYAIGILYAAILPVIDPGWLNAPTLAPALIVGIVTIAAGWFIMSPGMGNGMAASRAPNPWKVRGLGLAAHVVFGLGLYLGGLLQNVA
ncbi:DUF2938 domain-containing protein [Cereibacter sp. SYSU M97828]|nr:DUF2938 domain-containing protein [Cereibacter flavus]